MEYTGRVIACFIAVILIALFPLQYIAQSDNENIDGLVDDYTQALSDTIRDKGYLDKLMYENYVKFLDTTGELYDTEIEDICPVAGDDSTYSCNMENRLDTFTLKTDNMNVKKMTNNFNYKKITMEPSLKSNNTSDSCNRLIKTSIDIQSFSTEDTEIYVAVGDKVYYSFDRSTWHIAQVNVYDVYIAPLTGRFFDVVYGNGIFVVVGANGDSFSSRDGVNWTPMYGLSNAVFSDVEYGNGYFVCSGNNCVYYSADGAVWKQNTRTDNIAFGKLSYHNGIFTSLAGYLPMYSYNGIDWYRGRFTNEGEISGIKIVVSRMFYGKDRFFFCSDNCYGYSFDGINWTLVPNDGGYRLFSYAAIYANGNYYASGVLGTIYTSADFQSWSYFSYISEDFISDLYYSNGYFISTRYNGEIWTSADGVSWIEKSIGSNELNSITSNKEGVLCTLTSLSAIPTEQVISRYSTPSFIVTATYNDGKSVIIPDSKYIRSAFDSSIPGKHIINFSYTENGITKTADATVYVDALTGITVTPASLSVEKYTDPLPFTVTAAYLYSGSKTLATEYEINGYTPSALGEQNVTISYTEGGVTKTAYMKVAVTVLHKTCPRCQNVYDMTADDIDPGCPFCKQLVTGITVTPDDIRVKYGSSLPVTVAAVYNDGSSAKVYGWTSNYDPHKAGPQTVTVEYGGYAAEISVWVGEAMVICPVCGNEYPESEKNCPVCSDMVLSISASPDIITVKQHAAINLSVTAHYADGHSDTVTDWSIDMTTSKAGTFTATVSYQGVSTIITLTVSSDTAAACPVCGRSYEPADNPRGCPVCSKLLTGIEAYLTTGGNLVQLGSVPAIDIVLIFKDTHKELTTQGYTLENYDADKPGEQTVIVHYQEFSTNLNIEIVNNLSVITCPNGHVYYKNEDGSDPGCPYCAVGEGLGTVFYFDITYTDEILDVVYGKGIYYFKSGNFITVHVTKKDTSVLVKMQKMFYRTAMIGRKKEFLYGGEVL